MATIDVVGLTLVPPVTGGQVAAHVGHQVRGAVDHGRVDNLADTGPYALVAVTVGGRSAPSTSV